MGFRMAFANDLAGDAVSITLERQDVRDVEGQAEMVSLASRIEHLLVVNGAQTVDAITAELDAKRDSVSKTLRRMQRRLTAAPLDRRDGNANIWGPGERAARGDSGREAKRVDEQQPGR